MSKIVEPLIYYKYNTTMHNNVSFNSYSPKFEKVVISSDKHYEGELNGFYNIICSNNDAYKMYYRSGNHPVWIDYKNIKCYGSEVLRNHQILCVAETNDGVNFVKPLINNDTNIINMDKYFCHNFSTFYNRNEKTYIAISGVQYDTGGVYMFKSNNGYNWNIIKERILDETKILKPFGHNNHFDSLNTIVYNQSTNNYHIYARHNDPNNYRKVQVSYSNDLINFSKFNQVNIDYDGQIYSNGFQTYPNNNCYFIGLTTTHDQSNFKKKCILLISIDGVNWSLLLDNVFNELETIHFGINGIISTNEKIYLYCLDNADFKNNNVKCFSYDVDRIGCLYSNETGTFNSNLINLSSKIICLNYITNGDGHIKIELYDSTNTLIATSHKLFGDYKNKEILWECLNFELTNKLRYYLKFTLNNASIFSYSYNTIHL